MHVCVVCVSHCPNDQSFPYLMVACRKFDSPDEDSGLHERSK